MDKCEVCFLSSPGETRMNGVLKMWILKALLQGRGAGMCVGL